jgi:hypothetical protein
MTALEPRTTLARADAADCRLQGLAPAGRYADTTANACIVPQAPLRRSPDPAAEQMDELLFGEGFDVLEESDGWAWGQARRDGYVGYVRIDALAARAGAPTHRVGVLRTIGFSKPDIKSTPLGMVSLNALLSTDREEGRFVHADGIGWIVSAHLAPIGVFASDPAEVARGYLGAPYLWGGRSSLGLDCSGLVQQSFYACGRACPRDTDQQQAAFTRSAPAEALERGDLVFWKGHVGMMLDATRLIHANAHHMAVTIEPLADVAARIRAGGSGDPTAFRRP